MDEPDVGEPDGDASQSEDLAVDDPPIDDPVSPDESLDPPTAPTGVSASDGTSQSFITISWNASPGATSYRLLRDEVEIATGVVGTSYDDDEAIAYPPAAEGFNLAASDGTWPNRVSLSWDEPQIARGASHSYAVIAENSSGQSRRSASDTGYRAAPSINGYQLQIDDGEWLDIGSVESYDDLTAPVGFATPGSVEASDGTDIYGVQLDLDSVATECGPTVRYRIRAANVEGVGAASPVETGFRGEPTYAIQWQRSTDETQDVFVDIPDADGFSHLDVGGPIDASPRYYRCVVTPDGGEVEYSAADAGYRHVTRLLASDGEAADWFGSAVSISGDRILIGAVFDDDNGENSGSAYVFRFEAGTWVEEAKLTATDGAEGDWFGGHVILDGNRALISSAMDDDMGAGSGSVYVFRFNGVSWLEEQKITASDGDGADFFGSGISLEGDFAAVCSDDDDNGTNSGSVYVFRDIGLYWYEVAKLNPSDGEAFDFFCGGLSVFGDHIVVGATGDDDAGTNAGAAYTFFFDGTDWVEAQKLVPANIEAGDGFGTNISVSAGRALITADNHDDIGAVYVFRFDGEQWVEDYQLSPSTDLAEGSFGTPVSVHGDCAIVGARRFGGVSLGMAFAYLFSLDSSGWAERATIVDTQGVPADCVLGCGLDVSQSWAVLTAPNYDTASEDVGAALVFRLGD